MGKLWRVILNNSIIETDEFGNQMSFPLKYGKKLFHYLTSKKVYIGGILLVVFSMTGNVLNFVYNAYLGSVLDLNDFALISLMGGLFSFVQALFSSFTTTINYKSGYLIGKYGENTAYSFLKFIRKKVLFLSFIGAVVWILFTPFLTHFFPSGTATLFILFAIVLFTGLAEGANRGFLSAQLLFGYVAVINIIDPIIRLFIAFALVHLHHSELTYTAIPFAIAGSFLLSYYFIAKHNKKRNIQKPAVIIREFPTNFFLASFVTSLSSIVFLSVDILLANHYLNAKEAGSYGLLTLVGKMIYFLGALVTPFTIPLISRKEGANKSSKSTLYILAVATLLFSSIGFILFGLLGSLTLPLLYGKKVAIILPYVTTFCFGILCFTVSKVFSNYYLVKKMYIFTWTATLLAVIQFILIMINHTNIQAIAWDMTIIWIFHFIFMLLLHIGNKHALIFEQKVTRFCKIFFRVKQLQNAKETKIQKNKYKKKLPVSIALPVFNEEANIKQILTSIMEQKLANFSISEILIVSDGSTDKTVFLAKRIKDKRISIIDDKDRKGKALRINEIFRLATENHVVLLDADVILNGTDTLEKLLEPFQNDPRIGLISGKAIPVEGTTFVENSINISINAYLEMVNKINNGNNLYAVEGRILAIKKSVGRAIPLPKNGIATDAFLYFSTLKQNYLFQYVSQAAVKFYTPKYVNEHVRQNKRFVARKYVLKKYFGKIVEKESAISPFIYVPIMLKYLFKDPVHSVSILLINTYSKYLAKKENGTNNSLWPIASSTKRAIQRT